MTSLGTTTEQETVVSTLGKLASDTKGMESPALIIVGNVVKWRDKLSWFETKQLFGWRVLVPRTKEQAASLSDQLRGSGAVPDEVPTISVEPPRTPQQMDRAVKGLVTGRYSWVVFTSTNAVKAVREKFTDYGLDARAFAGLKVAAVGEQTAAALVEFGVQPDLVPAGEQSGEGLAAEWPPYDEDLDPINRVLLPRADIATDVLIARLTELGWECEDVTAYRTVRAAAAARADPRGDQGRRVRRRAVHLVLHGEEPDRDRDGKPHNVTVIAVIGPQTAKTAEEYGLRVDVMADKPSVSASPRRSRSTVRSGGRPRSRRETRSASPARCAGGPAPEVDPYRGNPCPHSSPSHARGGCAARPRCAGWSPRRGSRSRPRPADVRQGGHRRAAARRVHAGRVPAHPRQPAQGRARGGREASAASSCSGSRR